MFDALTLTLAQNDAPVVPQIQPGPAGDPVTTPMTPGTTAAPNGDATTTSSGPLGGMGQLLFFIVIIGVFWFILIGGQRREKKKRAALLAAVKKGDKVQTVGGIVGTVMELRENEVILKVDENSNTRIKFSRGAVQTVLQDKAD